MVSKLLAEAPGLRVLATSRHVLEIEGEQVLEVPPLSTPGDADQVGGDGAHYEAVALLTDRACAVDPSFQVTDENRAAVFELCRRLDGLPLALELAAVWLRSLSPAQIVDRLGDPFQLLASGRRSGPARHQALDAAVAWSYDLCSPEEQLLWSRLSVFSGGFDLDAAEEICAGDGVDRADVLELLAGLVSKSIVVRRHELEHAASWYRMLETIREYGARRLSSDQAEALRMRHQDHYRELATNFAAEYFTSHQAEWYLRLRREHGNIRAALEFGLGRTGDVAALDIAAPLWPWWHTGHVHEGVQYLTRALALAPEPSVSRGFGLLALGNLTVQLSEFDRALAVLAESADLADRFGDQVLSAKVKQVQGHALLHSGHPAEAVPLLEDARDEARRLGQPRDEWRNVNLLSLALMFLDDPRAEAVALEAVRLAEEHSADASRGWALSSLGMAQWRAGRHEDARRSLRDGIQLFLSMQNLDGASSCLRALSWCAASADPDERAARLSGATRAVWRSLGGDLTQAVYRELDNRSQELLRSALGERRFEEAFAEGASYSLDQALDLALGRASGQVQPAASGTGDRAVPRGGLTRREWEIAQLLGEGLSNKDIAARLVISQRTVEAHVEHILTKLGLTSRTQVSSWLMEERAR